jgi:hypothetical protein
MSPLIKNSKANAIVIWRVAPELTLEFARWFSLESSLVEPEIQRLRQPLLM